MDEVAQLVGGDVSPSGRQQKVKRTQSKAQQKRASQPPTSEDDTVEMEAAGHSTAQGDYVRTDESGGAPASVSHTMSGMRTGRDSPKEEPMMAAPIQSYPEKRGGGDGGNKKLLWVVAIAIVACVAFFLLGFMLGKENGDEESSHQNDADVKAAKCLSADGSSGTCDSVELTLALDRKRTQQLYEQLKKELEGSNTPTARAARALADPSSSAEDAELHIDTIAMLNWTDPASAGVFNYWAHTMKRADFKAVLKGSVMLELREPKNDDEKLHIYVSGMSNMYDFKIKENITLHFENAVLGIHSEAYSPPGEELDLRTISGATDSVWEDYVADEPITINSDEKVSLLAQADGAMQQATTVKTKLPINAAVDAAALMGLGGTGRTQHLHAEVSDRHVHTLSGPGVVQTALDVAGTLTKNGAGAVNLKSTAIKGPIELGGGTVRLYNMSLVLGAESKYAFEANADFNMGRHNFRASISGYVGYQPKKGQMDEHIHDIRLTGEINGAVMIEGTGTRVIAKPLRVILAGWLQAGLPACDAASKALGPCVEMSLPEVQGPSVPTSSTIAFKSAFDNDTDDDQDTNSSAGTGQQIEFARWEVTALIEGTLDFGFGESSFRFPLGHQADMFGQSRLFDVSVDVGVKDKLQVGATGRMTHGMLALEGRVASWTIPIGSGLTVKDLVTALDVEWEEQHAGKPRCSWTETDSKVDHTHNIRCPSLDAGRAFDEETCRMECDKEPKCMSYEAGGSLGLCCLASCKPGIDCPASGRAPSRHRADMSRHAHSLFAATGGTQTYLCEARDVVPGFLGPFADWAITGWNDIDALDDADMTVQQCAALCTPDKNCTSFDYGRKDSALPGSCFLSTVSQYAVPKSWENWPGYDHYEVPNAKATAKPKEQHFSISSGKFDPQVSSRNATRLTLQKWALQANSTISYGGAQWKFAFFANSKKTDGMYARLEPLGKDTLLNLVNGVLGDGNHGDPNVISTEHLGMVPNVVRIYTKPVWLRATVNSHIISSTGMHVAGLLSVRQDEKTGEWTWGVVLQTQHHGIATGPGQHPDAFTMGELVPAAKASGAFGNIRFSNGILAVANTKMNVTIAPGLQGFQDLADHLTVESGVTFGATIDIVDVAPVRAARSGESPRYIRVFGRYLTGNGPSKMTLAGEVKGPMAMTNDINLESLRVQLLADGAGRTQAVLSAKATVHTSRPGTFAVTGSVDITNVSQHAHIRGSIDDWQVADDLVVEKATLDLDLSRDWEQVFVNQSGGWGMWRVKGGIDGTVQLFGMDLNLHVPIPLSAGITTVSAKMPYKQLASGIALVDFQANASYSGDLSNFKAFAAAWDLDVAATLRIKHPTKDGENIDIGVNGRVSNLGWALQGTLPKLDIIDAVGLSNVAFTISGQNTTDGYEFTAAIEAVAEIMGKTVAIEASFQKTGSGKPKIAGKATFPSEPIDFEPPELKSLIPGRHARPLLLGDKVKFEQMDFVTEKGELGLNGTALIETGATKPLQLHVDVLIKGPGNGTCENWRVPKWMRPLVNKACPAVGGYVSTVTRWQSIEITGSVSQWAITDSLSLDAVEVDLSLIRAPDASGTVKTQANGHVLGEMTWSGLTIGARVPIPVSSDNTTMFAKADTVALGGGVSITDLDVSYSGVLTDFVQTSQVDAKGTVRIATPFARDPEVVLSAQGHLSKSKVDVNAQLKNWNVAGAFVLTDLSVAAKADRAPTQSLGGCWEGRKAKHPNCTYSDWFCAGEWCAKDGEGDPACGTARPAFVADPETGRCVAALCYEAYRPDFITCDRYVEAGYKCVGDQCAVDGCVYDCARCAFRKEGHVADPATGKCKTPWSLTAASLTARADLMGKQVGFVNVELPWKDGRFEIDITDLELAPSTTISGKLVVQNGVPQITLDGSLNVGPGKFDVNTVFAYSDVSQNASLSANALTWNLASGVSIDKVDVNLDLSRSKSNGQWGAVSAVGDIHGEFTLAGIGFEVDVPVPISAGQVQLLANMPPIEVVPGVTLSLDIKGVGSGQNMTDLLKNSEFDVTAELEMAAFNGGEKGVAQLTGKFGKNHLILTGSATAWRVAPGFVLQSLNFDVKSTGARLGSPNATIDCSFSATMDSPLGVGTTVSAKFFKAGPKRPFIDISMAGPFDIGGVNIKELGVTIPSDSSTPITFRGKAELPDHFGGAPGQLAITGDFLIDKTSGLQELNLDGTLNEWQATQAFKINNVAVGLELLKWSDAPASQTNVTGEISGDFEIGGMQLIASVPLPLMSGPITAEIPSVRLGPGVRLDDFRAKVGRLQDVSKDITAEVQGTLNVTTPIGPGSFELALEGTIGKGQFDLKGAMTEWAIMQGLTLHNLNFDIKARSTAQGFLANVSFDAATNVFGLEATMWAEFSGGKGHQMAIDGNIDFPNGDLIDFLAEKAKSKIPSRHALPLAGEGLKLGRMDFNYKNERVTFNTSAELLGGPRTARFALTGYFEGLKASFSKGVSLADEQHAVIVGSAEEWDLTDSLSIESVSVDLEIHRTNVSTDVSGSVAGVLRMGGFGLSAYVPVPISSGLTQLNATLDDIGVGPVTVSSGFIRYSGNLSEFAASSRADIQATIEVDTTFAVDPKLVVVCTGKVAPTKININGAMQQWAVVPGLTLSSLALEAELTKSQNKWTVWGQVEAEGDLLDGKVHVQSPFPWKDDEGLKIDFSDLRLSSQIALTSGTIFVKKTSPQFVFDATLGMGKDANGLAVSGSAGTSDLLQELVFETKLGVNRWDVTASVAVEAIDVDLTIRRQRDVVTAPWGSWDVSGLVQGRVDWGGNRIFAHVPLPLDDRTVMNASFPAISLGNIVEFEDARMEYRGDLSQFTRDPKLTVAATVKVATPFAADPHIAIDVNGYFSKKEISMQGKMQSWEVVQGVVAFQDVEGNFGAVWDAKEPSALVAGTAQVCYESATKNFPKCVAWDDSVHQYYCLGSLGDQQCARDGCRGDCNDCAVRHPGFFADPSTGTCQEALCYEAKPKDNPGCDYIAYTCSGDWCAVNGCQGDCTKCATSKPGLVADPATGRCSDAICFEAKIADFRTCDHAALGFTCVGDWCVKDGECKGDCAQCAHRRVGFKADTTEGRCVGGKWKVATANAKAAATVMGTPIAGVTWDFAGGLAIDMSGLQLGSNILVTTGVFKMLRDQPITFSAAAKIQVGPSIFIEPSLDGVVHNSSNFAINGSLATGGWDVLGIAVRDVTVELACAGSGKSDLNCIGEVFGRLVFWDNLVEVSVPVPFDSGVTSVYLPRMVFGPGTYLEDTLLERNPGGDYALRGNLQVKVSDQATPLRVSVTGTASKDCISVQGSTTEPWVWSVGKGFTINNVAGSFSIGKACPGRAASDQRTVAGSLSGSASFAGGTLTAAIEFGPSKGTELELRWSTAAGPSVLSIAGALADESAVPGSGSGGATDKVNGVAIQDLLISIKVKERTPTIWVRGKLAIFGGQMDLLMHISKNADTGKWYFVAAVDIPSEISFTAIEPGQGAVADKLGAIKEGYLAVATAETTLNLDGGRTLQVSPGVTFKGVIDMAGLGGKLGTGSVQTNTPSQLYIKGHWTTTNDILIKAELTDFPIGDHVILNAAAQFSTKEPIFTAFGDATVQMDAEIAPLNVRAEVHVWRGGDFDVMGKVANWRLDIGHSGFLVDQLQLNVSKRGAKFTADFHGKAYFNMSSDEHGKGSSEQSDFRIGKAVSRAQKPCQKNDNGDTTYYTGHCAFDGDVYTMWDTTGLIGGDQQWLQYSFDTPRRMTTYSFVTTEQNCPSTWRLEAGNLEGHWTTLDSRDGRKCNDNKVVTYHLPAGETRSFRHFRWVFSKSYTPNVAGSGYRLREVKMALWDVLSNYVFIGGDATCTTAGFLPTTERDQCSTAAGDFGVHEAALTTPETDALDSPSGCYIEPGKCQKGWLESDYGYQPSDSDVDGNQPLTGLTLTQCVTACEANPSCKSISRPIGLDDVAGDCFLKKTLLPRGDSRLLHHAACTSVDAPVTPGLDCANAIADAGLRGGLSEEAWCSGEPRPDNQNKEGLECARTCCDYWAKKGTATCGGTGKGRPCQFPFTRASDGAVFSACTPDDVTGQEWCGVVGEGNLWGHCNCLPAYGTYIVKCPEAGFHAASDSSLTCSAQHLTTVHTKEWCEAAGAALKVGGTVQAVTDEGLAGCHKRGGSLFFNTQTLSTGTGAANGATAVCHSGPSMWFNDLPTDATNGGTTDESVQPICGSRESHLSMELDVNIAGHKVNVSLRIGRDHSITGSAATKSMAHPDAVSDAGIPSDFSSMLDSAILEVTMFLSTSPPILDIQGSIQLARIGTVHAHLLVVKNRNTGKWNFALGVGLNEPFSFDQMAPSYADKGRSDGDGQDSGSFTNFARGTFLISSFPTPFNFMGEKVTNGVLVSAYINLVGVKELESVRHWTGVDELGIRVSFGFASSIFRFEAVIYGRWYIIRPQLSVTGGRLFIEAGAGVPGGVRVGLGIDLEVQLESQVLMFQGDLILGTLDIRFGARMLTDWRGPFGLERLTVKKTEFDLGIQYSCPEFLGFPCPSRIGLAGGLAVATVSMQNSLFEGSAAVIIDRINPSASLFSIRINRFSLDDILTEFGVNTRAKAGGEYSWFLIEGLFVSVNPSQAAKEFAGEIYQPGIHAKIDRFELFTVFSGKAELMISPTLGLSLSGQINPVNLFNGLFKISGTQSEKDPAVLIVRVNPTDPLCHIDGKLTLFGQSFGVYLTLSKEDWELKVTMSLLGGLLRGELWLKAVVQNSAPTDFSGSITFEQDLLDWMAKNVQQFVNSLKEQVNKKMDSAQSKLAEWRRSKQPKMDANNRRIAQIRREQRAAFDRARAWLSHCESKVRNARNTVNNWLNEIERSKRSFVRVTCRWYKPWDCAWKAAKNAGIAIKIAGLWVAHKAASGVLWLAEQALRGARSGLYAAEKIANAVDPRILALQAENGLIQAAYKIAQIGIEAARAVVNGAAALVNFVVKTLASLFNIKRIHCEATSVMKKPRLACDMSGIILGMSWDISFATGIPPSIEDITNSVKDQAKKKLGL
eukprot:TRINITY_DN2603_c0_g1_i9.p1 TRINITY_DN2603_c0_g1~~TRINITY_DN2603_c0_g1_i9.p1  ORF type:complete len:5067 (+),score=2003.27 TRINITY_DN2603_c0_g1_i9:119-15202(+)